jgi:hypothetical protein
MQWTAVNLVKEGTMSWSIKDVAKVLLVVAVISGGMLSKASAVWAQEVAL